MREDYWWEWGRGCEGGRTTGGNGGEGVSEGDYWWEWGRGCEGGRTTGGNGGEGVSEGGLLQ